MQNNNNAYDKAHELARAVIDSDIYRDYIAAKEMIEKHPEYKEKVDKIRKRQADLNKLRFLGKELPENSINEIKSDLAKLTQIREIAEFFNAEGRFIQFFNDIQEIIHQTVAKRLDE